MSPAMEIILIFLTLSYCYRIFISYWGKGLSSNKCGVDQIKPSKSRTYENKDNNGKLMMMMI